MENWERLTLDEMAAFVENNRKVRFKAKTQEETYRIIEAVLKEHEQATSTVLQAAEIHMFDLIPIARGTLINQISNR